jgi:penicillin V acylase-like amidase (Ntn superfamily)
MRRTLLSCAAAVAAALLWNPAVEACSRILWSDNGQAVLAARNMEFWTDDLPYLVVFPRGPGRRLRTDTMGGQGVSASSKDRTRSA